MTIDLNKIDWVAISALITTVMVGLTWWTLKNNRKQLRESQRQNFDNTFFQLLRLVKETFRNSTYTCCRNQATGTEAFEKAYNALIIEIKRRETKAGYQDDTNGDWVGAEYTEDISIENAKNSYREFYDRFPDVGLYFRTLYRLVKLINNSSMSDKEKYTYTSIIRAQMSDYELLWLFYNCTVGYGEDKFKSSVEKWVLLQNMRDDKLADESHYTWMDIKAFERGKRY